MLDTALQQELLTQATSGDGVALQELLIEYYDQLAAYVAPRIPVSLRAAVNEDDILQQTYVEVIRQIDRFTPQHDRSFYAWLKSIAHRRTLDAIRRQRAVKRGGQRVQVHKVSNSGRSSVADLVDVLSAGSHTPSRSAARHEAVAAVRQVIDALPDDYHQAVQLRLLEGKSLQETATLMDRTPRAVQGLIDRAKKKMRAALEQFAFSR